MMKNIDLCGLSKDEETKNIVSVNKDRLYCTASVIMALAFVSSTQAQMVNTGDVKVDKNTIMSVYMDYNNKSTGQLVNDGNIHVFQNWTNDGVVTYTNSENGKTFFTGNQDQRIDGTVTANFQNLLFDNLSGLIPFQLATSIAVNKKAEFLNGILDADSYNGLMIFNQNAVHSNTSDLSFVDGKVQKLGQAAFEYPVGDDLYFRPSYNAVGDNGNVYTTQYFLKNSNDIHDHSNKEVSIKQIDNTEYWNVTKDQGSDRLVLSLTMDTRTTPSEFFNLSDDKMVVIVRWDEGLGKWVNEGGVTSDKMAGASAGAGYTQLVTHEVTGYGIFTLAIADKVIKNDDLIVYNAISPNGDGLNDTFVIKGIEKYPDNTVEIFNRWGVKVYEAKGYNESNVMFAGYSDGRGTVNRGEKLPTGTYFYILKYNNGTKVMDKSGYLYINNQ